MQMMPNMVPATRNPMICEFMMSSFRSYSSNEKSEEFSNGHIAKADECRLVSPRGLTSKARGLAYNFPDLQTKEVGTVGRTEDKSSVGPFASSCDRDDILVGPYQTRVGSHKRQFDRDLGS